MKNRKLIWELIFLVAAVGGFIGSVYCDNHSAGVNLYWVMARVLMVLCQVGLVGVFVHAHLHLLHWQDEHSARKIGID